MIITICFNPSHLLQVVTVYKYNLKLQTANDTIYNIQTTIGPLGLGTRNHYASRNLAVSRQPPVMGIMSRESEVVVGG
jgi:hypothetical protein